MAASGRENGAVIGVVLAGEDESVHAALGTALAAEPDIDVLGAARDGARVPDLVARLRPDVVVMDVRMRAVAGIAAAPGAPRVLVRTAFGNDGAVYEALRAGATGFVLEQAPPAEVVAAVRAVARGDALLFPAAVRDLVATRGRAGARCRRDLGDRALAVLRAVARGLCDAEIAAELGLDAAAVRAEVAHLLDALGAPDRPQAVIAAYECGLIDPRRPL